MPGLADTVGGHRVDVGPPIGPARQGVEMATPVLLLVDEDRAVLEALAGDLGRRFGVDYQLLAEESPAAALTTLRQLAARSQQVALVLAGQQMTQMSGVELLVAAHAVHPAAKRVLLVSRGDYTAAHPAVRAMTLGQIDYHLFTPWRPAERWLYPPVSEFLADWSKPSSRRLWPSASSAGSGSHVPTSCATS